MGGLTMDLYTLANKYRYFEELYNSAENEEEAKQTLKNLYEAEDSLINKVDNISAYIKNLEGDITKFKNEENRLNEKRKLMENKQKRLKDYLYNIMEMNDLEKISTNRFDVRIQNNGQYTMNIEDESYIPERYYIEQEPKLDVKKLKDDITKYGLYIEGVEVYKVNHLRIH